MGEIAAVAEYLKEYGPFARQVRRVLIRLMQCPLDASTRQFDTRAEEADYYNLVNNSMFDPHQLIDAHRRMRFEYALAPSDQQQESPLWLAIGDTTELSFGGNRSGLYPLHGGENSASCGMLAHAVLLVETLPDGTLLPSSLASLETLVRLPKPKIKANTSGTKKKKKKTKKTRKTKKKAKKSGTQNGGAAAREQRESERARWVRGVETTNRLAEENGLRVLHIMDCEADDYAVFAALGAHPGIVRVKHTTRLLATHGTPSIKLCETIDLAAGFDFEELALRKRLPKKQPAANRKHPPREARTAHLRIGWQTVTLPRPQRANRSLPEALPMTLVWIKEDPSTIPADGEGIEWLLLTNQPIADEAAAREVVQRYRQRWIIEQFFKVFKVGTSIEERQNRSRETLENVMGLLLVVALEMFRSLTAWRQMPDSAAILAFDSRTLEVLKHVDVSSKPKRLSNYPTLTITQVITAIAQLGGYKPNKKPPGFKTLWHGFTRLEDFKHAFFLGRATNH